MTVWQVGLAGFIAGACLVYLARIDEKLGRIINQLARLLRKIEP